MSYIPQLKYKLYELVDPNGKTYIELWVGEKRKKLHSSYEFTLETRKEAIRKAQETYCKLSHEFHGKMLKESHDRV